MLLFYQFVLDFIPFLSLCATHQTLHWSVSYSTNNQGKELWAQSSRDDAEKLQAVETGTGNHRSIYFGQGRSDLWSKPQLPQILLTASSADAVQSRELRV